MVGIGLGHFDDETSLATNTLFTDAQVRPQLRATKPLGENTGNPEAGGTVAHRRSYLVLGVDGQCIRTAIPGRTSGDEGLFNCAKTL